MENKLQWARGSAGGPRQKNARRRAGLPARRFFKRFAGLSDVPAEDLEILSQRLQSALDLDPSSPVPALQSLVQQEVRKRAEEGRA